MDTLLRILFGVGLFAAVLWAGSELRWRDFGIPGYVYITGPRYLPTEQPTGRTSPFCSPCFGPHYNFMSGKLEFGISMFGLGGF